MREIDRGELRALAKVIDIDIALRYDGEFVDVAGFQTCWCLIRDKGTAIATRFLSVDGDERIALSTLQQLFAPCRAGLPPTRSADPHPGSLTVVICTRDRVDGLQATLESLAAQSDKNFGVLIVDNSTEGHLVGESFDLAGLPVRVVHEPIAGLSRARNRTVAEADSDVLAWIDDDETADPYRIEWVKRGFADDCRPQAVFGVMLPAELSTPAQVNFERYGGFNKGRGMRSEILKAGTPTVIDPLYPLPNFGAGGNMAIKTSALRAIGGFDTRLGAGTLTQGGEETLALSLILESGGTILHWPPAVTWHYHRRSDDALRRQFFGYSAGLTAYYMSLLLRSPRYLLRIIGFVPAGLRRMVTQRKSHGSDAPPADFPVDLIRAGRSGLLRGAPLYLREVVKQRHIDRSGQC